MQRAIVGLARASRVFFGGNDRMVPRAQGNARQASGGQTAAVEPAQDPTEPGPESARPTDDAGTARRRRPRTQRNFPAGPFEEALELASAIWRVAAGPRVRRLTLFEALERSPDSGGSRQLITNAAKYGLTTGSYAAEHLELTQQGRVASNPDADALERQKARFALAVDGIEPFKALYEAYAGKKVPSQAVMRDLLHEIGQPEDALQECVDTFIVNAKFLGLLRVIAGAERIVPIDQILDEMAREARAIGDRGDASGSSGLRAAQEPVAHVAVASGEDWGKVCFYVTPIGHPESEERQHSDLFLTSLVEPAVAEFDLRLVRADGIGKPGMITAQVIEHLVRARLVVADLSFHNPNVFYELALRHAVRLPVVQIIRASDRIPFDLDQFRTVQIDNSSIYTLVPQLESFRSQIASQIRRALSDEGDPSNPLTVFYPGFWQAVGQA